MNTPPCLAALSGATWLALAALALAVAVLVRCVVRALKPGTGAGPDDGGQGIRRADHTTAGSSFAEMHHSVIDPKGSRAYYHVWGAHGQKPLPRHAVSFWQVAAGLLPGGKPFGLQRAIRRTLATSADLRWGANREGVRRLIHPNGICLTGEWIIDSDQPTGYTGYFGAGKKGLIVARLSPSKAETRRGHWRSIGFVGKIYPSAEDKDRRFTPANFFTQEDLGGTKCQSIGECVFLNAPDVHAWRRGKGVFSLLLTGIFFARINVNATIRQLHEIAELRHPDEPVIRQPRCPSFLRLRVDPNHADSAAFIDGDDLDMRDEVMAHLYDRGNPAPQRELVFTIEVSGHDQNVLKHRLTDGLIVRAIPESSWKRIGRVVFKEAACSHNGDFVIHFHHPKWRRDPSDPGTTAPVA